MHNCKGIWVKVYKLFRVRSGMQWLVIGVVRELQRTLVQDLSLHFISPVLGPVRYSTGATALGGISKNEGKGLSSSGFAVQSGVGCTWILANTE